MINKIKKLYVLKGGVLFTVIVLALVLLCVSLSFLLLYQNNLLGLKRYLKMREHQQVVVDLQTYLSDFRISAELLGDHQIDLYGDGSKIVEFNLQQWGTYIILNIRQINKELVNKVGLLGWEPQLADSTALELMSPIEELAIGGAVSLHGDLKVRAKRIVGVNQENMISTRDSFLVGIWSNSFETKFRFNYSLGYFCKNLIAQNEFEGYDEIQKERNSFLLPTKFHFQFGNSEITDTLKGNIVIYCKGKIRIAELAYIEDCILIAEVIEIQNSRGCYGQFFAEDSIIVQNGTRLNYPTELVLLNSDTFAQKLNTILVKDSCSITGELIGLDLSPKLQKGKGNTYIKVHGTSSIHGGVYSDGFVDVHGNVNGKIIANQLLYLSNFGVQENLLHNLQLNSVLKSRYFLNSFLIQSMDNQIMKRILWLN